MMQSMRMRPLLLLTTLLAAAPLAAKAQSAEEKKDQKARLLNAELFIAIRDNDTAGVNKALARGADPNERNWLGLTPLVWAAARGNLTAADTLLAHRAQLNAGSLYGSALTFAVVGRHEDMALHLLDKGANIHAERLDKATPLMLAAGNGYTRLLKRMLAQKDNPNAQDADGATALIYAARNGHTAAAQMLLKAGAKIDTPDSHGRTALMYAAANSRADMVETLLANHAQVNSKDKDGATALLLAARYNGQSETISRLLKAGANVAAKDGHGATALSLANRRGYKETAMLLSKAGTGTAIETKLTAEPLSTERAVEKSLTALQTGMKTFASRIQCISCHHQGLGMMALGTAQQHGFAINQEVAGSYLKQIGEDGQKSGPFIHQALGNPDIAKTIPAVDIGDISIGAGYIFGGLIANKIPGNPGLEEMAMFLANQQAADGHWVYGFTREPIQSSTLTTTALILQVLRTYGPQNQQEALKARFDRARQWMLAAPTPQTEDKASRLLGLKWAGSSAEERQKFVQELLALQRPDGGWGQTPQKASDAYATGMALYALHEGGELAVGSPAYQRGVQYLLRTQDEDGSWYINKSTNPANTYLDAGFPHGESQYASFGATCWATMALVQANAMSAQAHP